MLVFVINLFIFLTIIDAFGSFIPELNRNEYYLKLHQLVEIPQKPIRKMLPPNLPFDLAPMVVIVFLRLLIEMV